MNKRKEVGFQLPAGVRATITPMEDAPRLCLKAYIEHNIEYFPVSLIRKAVSGLRIVHFAYAGYNVYGVLVRRSAAEFAGLLRKKRVKPALSLLDGIIFEGQFYPQCAQRFDFFAKTIARGLNPGVAMLIEKTDGQST